jgi:hypothetical protein
MNSNFAEALITLYPQVVTIDGDIAYDINNNIVVYDPVPVQELTDKNVCKETASKLLYETDWTTIPDVTNTANHPYLMNQAEFIAYRNTVRQLVVNPVTSSTFPTKPTEQWSS